MEREKSSFFHTFKLIAYFGFAWMRAFKNTTIRNLYKYLACFWHSDGISHIWVIEFPTAMKTRRKKSPMWTFCIFYAKMFSLKLRQFSGKKKMDIKMRNMNKFSTPTFMCFLCRCGNWGKARKQGKTVEMFIAGLFFYYAHVARKIPMWLATKDGIIQLNLILYSALRELESRHAYKWF